MEKKTEIQKLNHYSIDEVLDTYNIETIDNCEKLDIWLNAEPSEFSILEQCLLDELPTELRLNERNWNEEELKINFIGAVFRIARLEVKGVLKTFFERSLTGIVQGIRISIIADCMVASPRKSGNPNAPYFFLQVQNNQCGDYHERNVAPPEGQMLAAMILAQEINQDSKPLYGSWIQGKNWTFTILSGVEYCVSRSFDATDPNDLLQIVFILRKLKELILNR